MPNDPLHAPVLIVGAGPAGLTAAITLARYGVPFLLAERRRALSTMPRATVISTRTMELLRSWGLEEEITAAATDITWRLLRAHTLATADQGESFPVGIPSPEEAAMVSPTGPRCVPQDDLEAVLLRHLRGLGVGEVRFGAPVSGVRSGPDGIGARIGDRDVRARYLVAADGAHSPTRTALGIPMHGRGDLALAVSALFRAPLWDVLGEHRYGVYGVFHPEALGTFVPCGRGDRWVYGTSWEPGQDGPGDLTAADMAQRIRLGAGVPELEPRIETMGTWTYGAQLAERFRHHSAFLVGDAAHRVTPRGGTGMNTAVHSAHDLAWKLAWVLRGWAGAELLDSYEAERRPVAEHNVARSADVDGSVRGVGRELHVDLGARLPHVPLEYGRSTLDLLGPGWTLFCGPDAAPGRVPAGPPVAVRRLDAITARALGLFGGDTLLVRPDGAPAHRTGVGDLRVVAPRDDSPRAVRAVAASR